MNATASSFTECMSKLQRFARENPTRNLLVALGCGFAVGVLVRTLRFRPPESPAARLFADIRSRLHDIAAPVQQQANQLVESGASAVRRGVEHLHDLHVERDI